MDVAVTDVAMMLAALMDEAGVNPFVIAIKCQQVVKEGQLPGLDCHGKRWQPLLEQWAIQGRLKVTGLPPETWTIIGSSCVELVAAFSQCNSTQ